MTVERCWGVPANGGDRYAGVIGRTKLALAPHHSSVVVAALATDVLRNDFPALIARIRELESLLDDAEVSS